MLVLAEAPEGEWAMPEELLALAQAAWVESTRRIKWVAGGAPPAGWGGLQGTSRRRHTPQAAQCPAHPKGRAR